MVDYPEAERAYSSARRVSPHHLEGTDMYSTALYVSKWWHRASTENRKGSAVNCFMILDEARQLPSLFFMYLYQRQTWHRVFKLLTIDFSFMDPVQVLYGFMNHWYFGKGKIFDSLFFALNWQHMKKDVELSYLAQETVAMDRLSPQAWYVGVSTLPVHHRWNLHNGEHFRS